MRLLTDAQYRKRLAKKRPEFVAVEPYCKAAIPLTVKCLNCGNLITREANQHLRFGCPHCPRKRPANP